jgi:hypothetical protein
MGGIRALSAPGTSLTALAALPALPVAAKLPCLGTLLAILILRQHLVGASRSDRGPPSSRYRRLPLASVDIHTNHQKERSYMAADQPFLPRPDETRGDASHARAFILALTLLIGLTVVFLYGDVGNVLGEALRLSIGSSRPVPVTELGALGQPR